MERCGPVITMTCQRLQGRALIWVFYWELLQQAMAAVAFTGYATKEAAAKAQETLVAALKRGECHPSCRRCPRLCDLDAARC